jgi:RNA polymerase sigma-70 factor, ECF subfamily
MATAEDIEHLIARVALGDRAAFSGLYDATSGKLFGVCMRVLNDRASAEDAVQDAYMKIWRHAARYSANGMSPMTWMITIARNTAIDRLRQTRASVDLADVADHLTAPGPTPEQSVVAAGEARRIAACLEALEADRGAAVRGAYLEGQSYADLAARFSVPLNTMRTWLRRSLQSLQACMERSA